ncbi:MAG: polyprenyl synthetase family protein [Pseudomonadota bacterium]
MNNKENVARPDWIVPELGFEHETEALRAAIANWIERVEPEMHDALDHQFLAGSKYFRPLTAFSCYRAIGGGMIDDRTMRGAMALELFHNMTLVIDDILDRSETRRGKPTMHVQFDQLTALMASGFMVAETYKILRYDPQMVGLISELMSRLGCAEIKQWRERKTPLGVEDWRRLAEEDTGSMFEVAACIGDPTERLRAFGGYLGTLYHACDDVSDVRGTDDLGEDGGDEDIRDGILTLPASIAVRDPKVARMFQDPNPSNYADLAAAFREALPEAEEELDRIAEQAEHEAVMNSEDPTPLLALVAKTRALGRAD